jgi:hypothetical protein
MHIVKKAAAAFMLISTLALALIVISPPSATGQGSAPVKVVNTTAEPVPVTGSVTGSVTGTVTVANTRATPIFITEVAREAFAETLCVGSDCPEGIPASFGPPAGRRFVIEQIAGQTFGDSQCALDALLNGRTYRHFLSDADVFITPTRIYADGGPATAVTLTTGGDTACFATLSGYLERLSN